MQLCGPNVAVGYGTKMPWLTTYMKEKLHDGPALQVLTHPQKLPREEMCVIFRPESPQPEAPSEQPPGGAAMQRGDHWHRWRGEG